MDATDAASKTAQIQQLVGQLQNNLCNVSVMGVPDLDSLSNMDPNSLVDITGKDFTDQLKDSGRLGAWGGYSTRKSLVVVINIQQHTPVSFFWILDAFFSPLISPLEFIYMTMYIISPCS